MSSIGLVAIMLDEEAYVPRWLEGLRAFRSIFGQVLVVDGGSTDRTADLLRDAGAVVVSRAFPGHFADQRNFALDQLATDWVLELDADELASPPLLGGLPALIADAERSGNDVLGVPRLNFLDGQLVAGPGHLGLDFQYRIHRRACRWRGAVHEEVVGYRARCELRIEDAHYILHNKTSARHAARNQYYDALRP